MKIRRQTFKFGVHLRCHRPLNWRRLTLPFWTLHVICRVRWVS